MEFTTRKNVKKLVKDPLSFALMMENDQIKEVIGIFFSVLTERENLRGGKN